MLTLSKNLLLSIFSLFFVFVFFGCSDKDTFQISFDKNNDMVSGDIPPISVKENDLYILPPNSFSGDGSVSFIGWGDTPNKFGTTYPAGAQITARGDKVFYAIWSNSDSVIKFCDASDCGGAFKTYGAVTGKPFFMPNNLFTAPVGSTFGGWVDDVSGNLYGVGDEFTVTGSTTIYAQWETIEYNLDNYDNFTTFHVVNSTQLADLAKLGKDFDNKTITLMNDIDMSVVTDFKGFQTEFKGTFEGNNKKIIDMTINVTAQDVGLIATLGSKGIVRNLHLVGGSVTGNNSVGGDSYVGGIVGYNYNGTITNVSNSASVNGNSPYGSAYVGGIVGYNYGTITNASNSGIVTANDSGLSTSVGGIVGYNYNGTITNASNSGIVTGSGAGNVYVGGIVGVNNTSQTISNVYNIGSLTVTSGTPKIGGVVGQNDKGSFDKAYYLDSLGVAGVGLGTADILTSKDANNFTVSALAFDPALWEDKTFEGAGIINGVTTRAVIKSPESIKYNGVNYYAFTIFSVYTPTQLADLAKLGKDFDNKTIILMNDIDMSGVTDFKGFQTEFKGTFEGNNKKIIDMTINVTAERTGFIATLGSKGIVRNLHLVGGSVTGDSRAGYAIVGGIVGYNYGTITNVSNTGNVNWNSSYAYVGGIVGVNSGTITNASNTGIVNGNSSDAYVGGIVGYNYGTITNASNSGIVTGNSIDGGVTYVGGIVGDNSGTITNASNTGSVTGGSIDGGVTYVGGIVGYNYGTITNASNSGIVTGSGNGNVYVGGIVGVNNTDKIINNVYNIGSLTVTSGTPKIGGVVGQNVKGSFEKAYYLDSLGVAGVGGGTADTLTSKDKDSFTVSALAFDPALWEDKTFGGAGIINGVATRAVLKTIGF